MKTSHALILTVVWAIASFSMGYNYPRDVELESTAPVELHYEVAPEAARYLVLKAVKGMPHGE